MVRESLADSAGPGNATKAIRTADQLRKVLQRDGPKASIFFTVRRVLVVDDEENLRLVLRTLLRRHGYEV